MVKKVVFRIGPVLGGEEKIDLISSEGAITALQLKEPEKPQRTVRASMLPPEEVAKAREALKPVMEETQRSWQEAKQTVREIARNLLRKGYITPSREGFKCAYCGEVVTYRDIKEHFKSADAPPSEDLERLRVQLRRIYKRAREERLLDIFLGEQHGEVLLVVGRTYPRLIKRLAFELYRGLQVKLVPTWRARRAVELLRMLMGEDGIDIQEDKNFITVKYSPRPENGS
jgi:NAD(P)H-flavin reductase